MRRIRPSLTSTCTGPPVVRLVSRVTPFICLSSRTRIGLNRSFEPFPPHCCASATSGLRCSLHHARWSRGLRLPETALGDPPRAGGSQPHQPRLDLVPYPPTGGHRLRDRSRIRAVTYFIDLGYAVVIVHVAPRSVQKAGRGYGVRLRSLLSPSAVMSLGRLRDQSNFTPASTGPLPFEPVEETDLCAVGDETIAKVCPAVTMVTFRPPLGEDVRADHPWDGFCR